MHVSERPALHVPGQEELVENMLQKYAVAVIDLSSADSSVAVRRERIMCISYLSV